MSLKTRSAFDAIKRELKHARVAGVLARHGVTANVVPRPRHESATGRDICDRWVLIHFKCGDRVAATMSFDPAEGRAETRLEHPSAAADAATSHVAASLIRLFWDGRSGDGRNAHGCGPAVRAADRLGKAMPGLTRVPVRAVKNDSGRVLAYVPVHSECKGRRTYGREMPDGSRALPLPKAAGSGRAKGVTLSGAEPSKGGPPKHAMMRPDGDGVAGDDVAGLAQQLEVGLTGRLA
jgi:hypothetical protein